MISEILLGFAFGLSVCLPVGPINLLILNYSTRSLANALAIGFGAASCDFVYMLIFAFLGGQLSGIFSDILGIFGFLILSFMAFSLLFSKPASTQDEAIKITKAAIMSNFIKGWLLNASNPYVISFWLGVGAQFAHLSHPVGYAFGLSVACFGWVVALSLVVSHFKQFLKPKLMQIICIISGLILFIFAIKILINVSFINKFIGV